MHKTKEIAELAGISVRTLHHYDQIGLLTPAKIEENGYRFYDEADMERLQQILFFKELDFPLQHIKEILDDPNFDRKKALRTHQKVLVEKKLRLERMIRSIEQTIKSIEGGRTMSKKEMFEPFDMKKIEAHQQQYEPEVKEKYGGTKAYEESYRKTSTYQEKDWRRIKEGSESIYKRIIDNMEKGPSHEDVQQLIGELRQHITDNFYECTVDIFRGLGDLYVNDPRFTKNIDKYQPGLAQFLREAMHVYCDRAN
jgi:DNA-binding transcriptional MerR regulator